MVQGCEVFPPLRLLQDHFFGPQCPNESWDVAQNCLVLEMRLVKLGVSAMCICWGFKSTIRHAVCRCWMHNPVGENCVKQ